ncbi:hypothetical protein ABWH93_15285 [Seohaeicola saemankumensis]|uniref:hypothetical protein n=1 Tax=Seohaeicola TaxID=481178 RepID=UPI0035D03ACE
MSDEKEMTRSLLEQEPGRDNRYATAVDSPTVAQGEASANTATKYRIMKWDAAVMALTDLAPKDAAQICVAVLDEAAAGMPGFDPWGDIRADAAFWADVAHPAELEIYAAVAMEKLGQRALGKQMRKRVFKDLWRSFTKTERTAFLRHVQGRSA